MIKQLFQKYQNLILYLIFNWIATLINFIIYWLLSDMIRWNYLLSNGAAWFGGIIAAYFFNRWFVFRSRNDGLRSVAGEFVLYFGCRILSGVADMLVLAIGVERLGANDIVGKLAGAIVAFFINYIVSRWLVFRKEHPVMQEQPIVREMPVLRDMDVK